MQNITVTARKERGNDGAQAVRVALTLSTDLVAAIACNAVRTGCRNPEVKLGFAIDLCRSVESTEAAREFISHCDNALLRCRKNHTSALLVLGICLSRANAASRIGDVSLEGDVSSDFSVIQNRDLGCFSVAMSGERASQVVHEIEATLLDPIAAAMSAGVLDNLNTVPVGKLTDAVTGYRRILGNEQAEPLLRLASGVCAALIECHLCDRPAAGSSDDAPTASPESKATDECQIATEHTSRPPGADDKPTVVGITMPNILAVRVAAQTLHLFDSEMYMELARALFKSIVSNEALTLFIGLCNKIMDSLAARLDNGEDVLPAFVALSIVRESAITHLLTLDSNAEIPQLSCEPLVFIEFSDLTEAGTATLIMAADVAEDFVEQATELLDNEVMSRVVGLVQQVLIERNGDPFLTEVRARLLDVTNATDATPLSRVVTAALSELIAIETERHNETTETRAKV